VHVPHRGRRSGAQLLAQQAAAALVDPQGLGNVALSLKSLHQQRAGARSVGERSISHRRRHDPQSSARHRAHAGLTRRASVWPSARRLLTEDDMRARRPAARRRPQPASESKRNPAPEVERLVILLSVAEPTPPHRDVHPGMRVCESTTGRRRQSPRNRAARYRCPAAGATVVLNQQPAPRGAPRDDLVGLPSTWVIARIAPRAT
jgi:hypothetical protein